MLHGPKRNQKRAKQLRRAMTLPEILLWRELKKRPAELRFRHQHPAGEHYVLDFFCPRHKLAVEVDGEAHERGDRPERDAVRDAWVSSQGVRTLRIPAVEVLNDLDAVVRYIVVTALGDYPSTAFGGPPPPPGEE
ncbi:endonuclease domain-containing protein [Sphingomonas sp. MG17]|uniref:Endonuclease domain-containing protein n=1 Tax=Sphingomonas tagetis TaxID=2949092 RepID=A0A9X2HJT2_9SPHN|nr:endonuclease domain-containing protein [Sphingomonas tagetis]MCP3729124.1 endonuclease domain-containing protein [Sphingomonas tagetis]